MKKRLIAVILAVAMVFTLASCKKADSGNIKIGLITPMTGEVAVYGMAVKNAVELYINAFNDAGGIDGRKIELIVYDDKGDATESVNAYQKLVTSDEVVAIIGAVTSTPTLAVMQASVSDNIPMITPTATHPDVTSYGKNAFRACYTDDVQAISCANFAKTGLEVKTAAIIYGSEDPYSTGLKEVFEAKCEENGIQIVAVEGYSASDVDYKSQLTNIIAKEPEVLFVPDYYNTVYTVAKQARELGYEGEFLGVDGVDGVLAIEGADVSYLDGLYFSNHYATDTDSQAVRDFIDAFQKKYNEVPNALAALGYDAADILVQAVALAVADGVKMEAGKECYQAIIDKIATIKLDGVTGNITFDADHNTQKTCTIITVINGEYKSIGSY